MRVLLCVKQTFDVRAAFDTASGNSLKQVQPEPIYVMNPADRCALEFAVQLKQRGVATEVTAAALGPPRVEAVLHECLARGVDRALRIGTDSMPSDPFEVARELAALALELQSDLILCGTASLDENSGVVGPAVAAALGIPQITGVVGAECGDRLVKARRKLERGAREVVEAELPCLLAVEPTMNEPRYLSQRQLWHARGRQIETRRPSRPVLPEEACSAVIMSIDTPRPRPKWVERQAKSMTSSDKMRMMMGGAKAKKKADDFVEGKPEVVVEEIIKFLKAEGVLP